ncbi:MAG: ATP-binding protein, partial [Caldimonas sp.]
SAHGQQLVGAAARASKRGAELTGKLLAFSRRQVLQPRAVDTTALIDSLADMLRRTLDQRIRIEVDAIGCPPCLADPGQLESALLNIAINARDAMADGGTLAFRAAACVAPPDDVRSELDRAAGPGAFVALSISDTGTGMADDVKERAFEPFFTTKEAGRGTGLGLSTVYGFVKQSKGAVAIDSVLGRGTTVTLYIPAPDCAADAAEGPNAGDSIPRGLRVLLVEDDAEVRTVVRTFLDGLGCAVTACASAEQALATLTGAAGFDVLLSDIALGAGMRGTQLGTQAQQRAPRLGVVLMSGYSTELLDADRESPPAWELLRKPFSRDELARAVAKVIETR